MTRSVKCASCGAVLDAGNKKRVVCPYCGSHNIVDEVTTKPGMIVCPRCSNENPQDHEHCSQCGADLYYVCPKCGTRNSAEMVHCIKCGANIANSIKEWQTEQARTQQLREQQRNKKRKTARVIWTIIGSILLLFIIFAVTVSIARKRSDDLWRANATVTANAYFQNTPYKWESPNGEAAVMFEPEISDTGNEMFIWLDYFNNSSSTCTSNLLELTAEDNLGNIYKANQEYVGVTTAIDLKAGYSIKRDIVLQPWLAKDAKKLTIKLPEFCGYSDGSITIDLTDPAIEIKSNSGE